MSAFQKISGKEHNKIFTALLNSSKISAFPDTLITSDHITLCQNGNLFDSLLGVWRF